MSSLDALADVAARIRTLETVLASQVQEARSTGATWTQIGDALGITRQGARQRWGRDELTAQPAKPSHRIDYERTKGRRWVAACTTCNERSNALGSQDRAYAWAREHERS